MDDAEHDARTFLARLAALKRAEAKDGLGCAPVASGALRRASMELTRSLAAMRKPEQW